MLATLHGLRGRLRTPPPVPARGACERNRPLLPNCAYANIELWIGQALRLGPGMDFDAAIVGAGHNGLAAAVHLASRGWSVGVFELSDAPGGAVRTEEVTLPGFRHDLYAMNLSLFAGSRFVAEHGEGLRAHGLAFAPAEHCFASPMRDGRWFGVSKDLAATRARAGKFSQE